MLAVFSNTSPYVKSSQVNLTKMIEKSFVIIYAFKRERLNRGRLRC